MPARRRKRVIVPRQYPGPVCSFGPVRKRCAVWKMEATAGNNMRRADLEVHEIDGDHGNILNEPNVRHLASALRARIEQARAEHAAAAQKPLSVR